MTPIITPPHNLDPAKVDLARKKLVELEKSNEPLYKELMKLSPKGFDMIYTEMKDRGIL